MKMVCKFAVMCLPFASLGANVIWDAAFVEVTPSSSGIHDVDVSLGAPPYLPMWGDYGTEEIVLLATADTFMEYANTFVRASFGDRIDTGFMNGQTSYFTYAKYGEEGSGRADYSLTLADGESVYLAFVNESAAGEKFGWVQLGFDDGTLKVYHSAWDLDGNAMIVGGGAIPEPTSGLLFLFGLAALAMRRGRSDNA